MKEVINKCSQNLHGPFREHSFMMHGPHAGIFLPILFLILLIVYIKFSVAWIVYKDAVSKNIENRKLWFSIVFLTTIFGVLFYFLMVIYQHKNNNVNNTNQPSSENVSQVKNLPMIQTNSGNKICKNCGIEGDGKFCSKCGTQY